MTEHGGPRRECLLSFDSDCWNRSGDADDGCREGVPGGSGQTTGEPGSEGVGAAG